MYQHVRVQAHKPPSNVHVHALAYASTHSPTHACTHAKKGGATRIEGLSSRASTRIQLQGQHQVSNPLVCPRQPISAFIFSLIFSFFSFSLAYIPLSPLIPSPVLPRMASCLRSGRGR
jgi:hypothetical protein